MSLLIRLERLPWKGRPTDAARHYVCERKVSRVIPISFPSWASQGRVREKLEEWMRISGYCESLICHIIGNVWFIVPADATTIHQIAPWSSVGFAYNV
jgi:hypothetical protein